MELGYLQIKFRVSRFDRAEGESIPLGSSAAQQCFVHVGFRKQQASCVIFSYRILILKVSTLTM